MRDEELQRERRDALTGTLSRRRLVELTRLASELRALEDGLSIPSFCVMSSMLKSVHGSRALLSVEAMCFFLRHGEGMSISVDGVWIEAGSVPARFFPWALSRVEGDVQITTSPQPRPITPTSKRERAREKTRANVRRRPPRRIP